MATKASLKAAEINNTIPDTSTLGRKTNYNTKNTEIQNKVPFVSNSGTKLRIFNTTVTSNKTRQVHTETKLSEHVN